MTSDEFKAKYDPKISPGHKSQTFPSKESITVLNECIELQNKKSLDYQNPKSNVTQAMHYRRGIDSIHDIIHGKIYRAQSLIESADNPNFESLEDTYKDIINYCSFAVSYLRGKMEGQREDRDIFNRPIPSDIMINELPFENKNSHRHAFIPQHYLDNLTITDEDDGSRC